MFRLDWRIFICNLSLSFMRWRCVSLLNKDGIRLTHHLNFLDLFLKLPVLGLVFGIFCARRDALCVIL